MFQVQISFFGLVANPTKTLSLPGYLLSFERKIMVEIIEGLMGGIGRKEYES